MTHHGVSQSLLVIPICIRGSKSIPVCIWGSRRSPYAYGDRMTCNPRMHTGIKINPRMHTGMRKSPYAYGDRMDTNPRMHTGICASLYAYGDFSVTHRMHTGNISIWEIRSCIPICVILHTGIAVCGIAKKFAYGDPVTHNEVVRI